MGANDLLGRVTYYSDTTGNRTTTYDKDNRILSETGTDGTTTYKYYTDNTDNAGTAAQTGYGELANVTNVNSGTTTNTYYAYQDWDQPGRMGNSLPTR